MADFIKKAALLNKRLEFNFREVYNPEGRKYFITVKDGLNEAGKFEMTTDSFGNWKILDPAPEWVKEMEYQLIQMVMNPFDEERRYTVPRKPADPASRNGDPD